MTYEQEARQTTSAAAVWSLVLGIFAMLCLGCIAGVPAVICGHVALAHIKKSAGLLTGDGMAIAGLIMGYLSLAAMIVVVPIVAAIAIPSFANIRSESQKATCINNMRMIRDASEQWAMAENKQEGDAVAEADITPYLEDGQLPVCPKQGVYKLGKVGGEPRCSVHGELSGVSDRSDESDTGDGGDDD